MERGNRNSENPWEAPSTVDLNTTDQPRHRSFQMTRTESALDSHFPVGTIGDAVRFTLLQQIFLLFMTSLILDGGGLLRCTLFATVAFWAMFALISVTRRLRYRDSDLLLFKWGYVPLCVIVFNIDGILRTLF